MIVVENLFLEKLYLVKNSFIEKTYVVGTHWSCLIEAIPMCTYSIKLLKIIMSEPNSKHLSMCI